MSRTGTRVAVITATTLLSVVSLVLALSTGAPSGHSGGPANIALNCTACHPFNHGTGRAELIDAPRRYRAGEVYDLTLRITAPNQDGAGFEMSAEGISGHEGTLLISDAIHTRYADFSIDYVTHTWAGLKDTRAHWKDNEGSYDYHLQWQAPSFNAGPVTFFTAVNAVDDLNWFLGVRYYATYAKAQYAQPGDDDGDGDVDLSDHKRLADCLSGPGVPSDNGCEYVDTDGDGDVDLVDVATVQTTFTDATAILPADYVLADAVRGGVLYDKWWKVNGAAEPTGDDHPLYPDIGQKSGSTTYRCKECHGWDYKGRDGAYGPNSTHYTDTVGVQNTTLTPQELFDLLKSPDTEAGGHDMGAYGMSDRDLWDVVKMTLDAVIETEDFIDVNGEFMGNANTGMGVYNNLCFYCHGTDGTDIDFGGGEFVGTVANQNPWEFLHKVRFSHPGAPMPSFELLRWEVLLAADVGAHAATLPQEP